MQVGKDSHGNISADSFATDDSHGMTAWYETPGPFLHEYWSHFA